MFASPCPFPKRQKRAAARLAQGFHTAARLNFVTPRTRGNCRAAAASREARVGWRTGMGSRSGLLLLLLPRGAETLTLRHQLGSPKHWWRVYALICPPYHQCGLHTVLERTNKTSGSQPLFCTLPSARLGEAIWDQTQLQITFKWWPLLLAFWFSINCSRMHFQKYRTRCEE